jgi:hypothetical protein
MRLLLLLPAACASCSSAERLPVSGLAPSLTRSCTRLLLLPSLETACEQATVNMQQVAQSAMIATGTELAR